MTDMRVVIEEATRKLFLKKSFVEQRPDVLGVHEGYSLFSELPVSTSKGREARDRNKTGFSSKRIDSSDLVKWPKTKYPQEPRALSPFEEGMHKTYLKLSKEPEYAY